MRERGSASRPHEFGPARRPNSEAGTHIRALIPHARARLAEKGKGTRGDPLRAIAISYRKRPPVPCVFASLPLAYAR